MQIAVMIARVVGESFSHDADKCNEHNKDSEVGHLHQSRIDVLLPTFLATVVFLQRLTFFL